jgi:hypothetical protein
VSEPIRPSNGSDGIGYFKFWLTIKAVYPIDLNVPPSWHPILSFFLPPPEFTSFQTSQRWHPSNVPDFQFPRLLDWFPQRSLRGSAIIRGTMNHQVVFSLRAEPRLSEGSMSPIVWAFKFPLWKPTLFLWWQMLDQLDRNSPSCWSKDLLVFTTFSTDSCSINFCSTTQFFLLDKCKVSRKNDERRKELSDMALRGWSFGFYSDYCRLKSMPTRLCDQVSSSRTQQSVQGFIVYQTWL